MLPSAAKMRRAALAEALGAEGVEVFRPDSEPRGWPGNSAYSDSHILAVDARSVGDGMSAAKALERVNILASLIDLPANKTGTNRSRFEQSASGGLPAGAAARRARAHAAGHDGAGDETVGCVNYRRTDDAPAARARRLGPMWSRCARISGRCALCISECRISSLLEEKKERMPGRPDRLG